MNTKIRGDFLDVIAGGGGTGPAGATGQAGATGPVGETGPVGATGPQAENIMPEPPDDGEVYGRKRETSQSVGSWVSVQAGEELKEYTTTIGNNSSITFLINHNLNTKDVDVIVFDNNTGESVLVENTRTSVNDVTLYFAKVPTTDQYRVIVRGGTAISSVNETVYIYEATDATDAYNHSLAHPNAIVFLS